jgi:hypothetical protein
MDSRDILVPIGMDSLCFVLGLSMMKSLGRTDDQRARLVGYPNNYDAKNGLAR